MLLTREDALALFEQRRQAWLREDIEAYLALWSEDMTFQSPVHAEPLRGRAAFAELVRQSFAFSRPLRFDFEHIAVHGAVVLAEWTIAVERRDSGRILEWHGMSVAEIRDGVIRMWREYWNPAFLMP
jgi:ketosteroid isomerase-like protein